MPDRTTPRPRIDLESDDYLVRAAQRGDRLAFDQIVKRHQGYLYRLMLRACHHPEDAEDVAAEALAEAYEHLSQFRFQSSFVTWLGKIGIHLCLRRKQHHRAQPVPATRKPTEGILASPELTPEQVALRTEVRRMIDAALGELPEPDRTVLRLRDVEQRTAQEVSQMTGLTVPAVKARLHRARRTLRERLNDFFLTALA